MTTLSRRDFIYLSLAASAGLAHGAEAKSKDVHQQLLDLAAKQEEQRRARFAAVKTKADLDALQKSLRESFLQLLDGFAEKKGVPAVRKTGTIEADDYTVDKLVFESFPGYFVPAVLYKPKKLNGPVPGVISPCGHSTTGKAADTYQILHINLAKRGYVVFSYDPVGQGERSQYWDAEKGKSRFNLGCGEHAVLGNPLYLLGTSLARYRIWDGMRGLDYLTSLEEVDAKKIGCVGNSGGGTLSAYLSALDPRITVPAICCYITTLRRRMGNRIEADPDSDPEQDIYNFVGEGIDHAGLVALCAPRPTLLGTAKFDFFPIEGARETFAEAKKLYEAAGVGERIERAEADAKHGLSLTLRKAVYKWFDRWLAGRNVEEEVEEIAVKPRTAKELLVCADGQVNRTFQSRPLLPLAMEQFNAKKKQPKQPLKDLLRLDPESTDFAINEISALTKKEQTLLVCINGNETWNWQEEKDFLAALAKAGHAVSIVDPRGVGKLRPDKAVKGHEYADPLVGVEENIAYNAFLVGKSLLGMRVSDVLAAVSKMTGTIKPQRVVLFGRRDAALVAAFTAAVEPGIARVAVEEMLLSYLPLFDAVGRAINAASILPSMLRNYGDIADVLAEIAPRNVFVADGIGTCRQLGNVHLTKDRFSSDSRVLLDWLTD